MQKGGMGHLSLKSILHYKSIDIIINKIIIVILVFMIGIDLL